MRVIKGVAVWLLLGVAICITDFGGVELCIPWASGFIFIATETRWNIDPFIMD